MPTTQDRLDQYLAAETAILQAQEVRGGDRAHRMADLEVVRKQIDALQRQLAREQATASGQGGGGLRFKLANLSGSGQ